MLRIPRVLVDNAYREFLYGWPEYEANNHTAYARYARKALRRKALPLDGDNENEDHTPIVIPDCSLPR